MSRQIEGYKGKSERKIPDETWIFHINGCGYIVGEFFKTGCAIKFLFDLICLTICPPAYYTLIGGGIFSKETRPTFLHFKRYIKGKGKERLWLM